MGEPLRNIDNVKVDEQGLHFSPRKVTISTSGLVPQLKHFLRESNCALAVSLNATTEEVRNWVMPINCKYNLALLLGILGEEFCLKHNYEVLFEYVMLTRINDSIEDAKRLINLVHGIPCKINLISFNPHCGSQFKPTSDDKMTLKMKAQNKEWPNMLLFILLLPQISACLRFSRSSRRFQTMAVFFFLVSEPIRIQEPFLFSLGHRDRKSHNTKNHFKFLVRRYRFIPDLRRRRARHRHRSDLVPKRSNPKNPSQSPVHLVRIVLFVVSVQHRHRVPVLIVVRRRQ